MAEEGPEQWYRSLPPITRGYLTACFGATVLAQLELVSPLLLYLDFDLVLTKFELWRLLTNFCFFGTFSLPFVFSMFFLVRYGKEVEAKRFEGRAADCLWFYGICGLIMIGVAFVLGGQPFLASSMLSALVYLWSREFAEQTLSMFGLFNVQAFYFPWVRAPPEEAHAHTHHPPTLRPHSAHTPPPPVSLRQKNRLAAPWCFRLADHPLLHAALLGQVLCAIRVLMGGSMVPDLIGIFAGHIYYFLEDVQGYRLRAPLLLSDALDTPVTGAAAAAVRQRNAFGGHQWGGGGQRLGGN